MILVDLGLVIEELSKLIRLDSSYLQFVSIVIGGECSILKIFIVVYFLNLLVILRFSFLLFDSREVLFLLRLPATALFNPVLLFLLGCGEEEGVPRELDLLGVAPQTLQILVFLRVTALSVVLHLEPRLTFSTH